MLAQAVERGIHVDCVPKHDGIGHETKCAALILLALSVAFAVFTTLAMVDGAGDRMTAFTPIELGQNTATTILVIGIVEQIDRLVDPSNLNNAG